jgi:hypothetical protein
MPPDSSYTARSAYFVQAHEAELLFGAARALAVDAAQAQAQRDVVAHVQPGHQRVLLEHDAAVGAGADHRLAVEQDLARWTAAGSRRCS